MKFSFSLTPCSKTSKRSPPQPPTSSRICGGFFDVPSVQKRLGELDALMGQDTFWTNREKAQAMIDEANNLRKKIDPLIKAERQLDDFKVMTELAESEPETEQVKHQTQMDREMSVFIKDLDKL